MSCDDALQVCFRPYACVELWTFAVGPGFILLGEAGSDTRQEGQGPQEEDSSFGQGAMEK